MVAYPPVPAGTEGQCNFFAPVDMTCKVNLQESSNASNSRFSYTPSIHSAHSSSSSSSSTASRHTQRTWLPARVAPLFGRNRRQLRQLDLTPDLQWEQQQSDHVKRSAIAFSVSTCFFSASLAGLIFSSVKLASGVHSKVDHPNPATASSPDALEPILPLTTNSATILDKAGWTSSTYLYTTAILVVITLVLLLLTLRNGARLLLAMHHRKLQKTSITSGSTTATAAHVPESTFYRGLARLVQPGSSRQSRTTRQMREQQPMTLPTYQHAVRQAVLKRSMRQGGQLRDFYTISEEEEELERIRRLGGAPPRYPNGSVADLHVKVSIPADAHLAPSPHPIRK